MLGILYIEHNIPFDKVTLLIIASPIIFLGTLKALRRMGYRINHQKKEKENESTDAPRKLPFRLFGRIK